MLQSQPLQLIYLKRKKKTSLISTESLLMHRGQNGLKDPKSKSKKIKLLEKAFGK